jgi:hypothetical protein
MARVRVLPRVPVYALTMFSQCHRIPAALLARAALGHLHEAKTGACGSDWLLCVARGRRSSPFRLGRTTATPPPSRITSCLANTERLELT